jgi:hypothetical protein
MLLHDVKDKPRLPADLGISIDLDAIRSTHLVSVARCQAGCVAAS